MSLALAAGAQDHKKPGLTSHNCKMYKHLCILKNQYKITVFYIIERK